jgi:hypothetical protein
MQGLAAVAQLPARLLAAAPALAAGPLAAQRITRGWFAAVVPVFAGVGQARLQLLILYQQLLLCWPKSTSLRSQAARS